MMSSKTRLPHKAMKKHGCTVLSHGATGRGNDQVRFERYSPRETILPHAAGHLILLRLDHDVLLLDAHVFSTVSDHSPEEIRGLGTTK